MKAGMKNKIEPVKIKGLDRAVETKTAAVVSNELPMDAGPADEWMAQHPTFDEIQSDAPAEEVPVEEAPTEEPQVEAPAEGTPEPTTEEAPAAPAEEVAVEQPQAKTEEKPAEIKPAEAPKTFAADERFALADGNEWTRAQIIEGLQRANEYEPLAKEAQGFQKLFASNLEQATQNWGPLLGRLAKEPTTLDFIDKYLGDPQKAAYLETCAKHFDENRPPSDKPATVTATITPEAQKQLDDLKAFKDRVEREQAVEKVNREMEAATNKYPFLATDAAVRNDLLLTAQMMNMQDSSKGITDALAAKASIYDALLIARTQAPAVPVVQQPVPALPTASGATPTTQSAQTLRPKKFEDTVDAVDDWYNNPPPQFRG